jgi:hypothetical protein
MSMIDYFDSFVRETINVVRLEPYPALPENTYLEIGQRTNGTRDLMSGVTIS